MKTNTAGMSRQSFTEQTAYSGVDVYKILEKTMMMHQPDQGQPQDQQCTISGCTIQLILVRHGIALHNVIHHHTSYQQQPPQQTHDPLGNYINDTNLNVTDENYLFDPPLTTDGKIQAVMIGETIRQFLFQQQQQQQRQQQQKVDCRVLTSPLTRCLQTSTYAFGVPQDYDTTTTNSSFASTTIHCHENLREACGIYNCDRRRTKTQLQHYWGRIIQFINHHDSDSSLLSSDHDTLWHPTQRETIYELQCRIAQFMAWLLSSLSSSKRSQQHNENRDNNATVYVLVTHGVWIETMLQMYDPAWSSGTTTEIRRIQNADIYNTECSYTATFTNMNIDVPPKSTISNIRLQNVRQIPTSR